MDVAVLGCGYVGLELCRQLTVGGHDTVGVRRSPDGIDAILEAGFEAVREGDVPGTEYGFVAGRRRAVQ